MFVAGPVLDPDGKPVTNARAMVYPSLKRSGRGDRMASFSPSAFGQGKATAGPVSAGPPRLSSSRNDDFSAVAISPGYGAGWVGRSTPMPTSPPPTSPSGPSRSSRAGCSTCRVGPAGRRGIGRAHGHDRHRRPGHDRHGDRRSLFLTDQPTICRRGPARRLRTPTAGSRSGAPAGASESALRR